MHAEKTCFGSFGERYDTRRHHRPTIWQMVKRPSVLMHSPYVAGLQKYSRKASKACIGVEEASPRGISLRFGNQTNHSKTKLNPRTVATPSAVRTPNRRERLAQVRVKIGRFGLAGPQPPPDKPQQCYQARAGTMRAIDRSRQTTEAGRVFSLAPIGATAACFLHPLRRYYP